MKTGTKHTYTSYVPLLLRSTLSASVLRVRKGGHDVNHNLILERYYNSLNLLKEAVSRTHRSFIWDNSGKEPKLILEVFQGRQVNFKVSKLPAWVDEYLVSKRN